MPSLQMGGPLALSVQGEEPLGESIEEGVRTYFKGKEDSKWDVRLVGTGWGTPPTLPHLEDCPVGALAQATEPLEALLEEGLGPVGVIAGALQHLGVIAVE